jgi:very-short-patch-repair endonuclease
MSYNDFQQGHRCPNHRESRGEKLLKTILGRIYPEHTIKSQDSLGFLGRLRVDYSIPKLKLAFEYDGLHHFQPVQFGGISAEKANLAFKRQRKNDQKKQKMCEENGYRLIRLGYSESLTVEHIKDKIIKAGA